MEFTAKARFTRVSPQKARLVLDLIKGRRVEDALTTLTFTKKRIAPAIFQLLRSAVENANYLSQEKGMDVDLDRLYVKHAIANEGPRMKRIRPAPMGRAFRYQRRISHMEIVLAEKGAENKQDLATVVGEEDAAPAKTTAKKKAVGAKKKSAGKKKTAAADKSFEIGITFASAISCAEERLQEVKCMGQKVHPYGFRLGYTKPWRSRWFIEKDYDKLLLEDVKLKEELKDKLKSAGVSSVEIERPGNKLRIIIRTARPGIIIGRKGAEIDKLKIELQKRTNRDVFIDIQEVHKPELDAQLVSEGIALQLEKRVGFRRAMRKSVDSALRFGCKGIKVRVSGRLNGNEIARSEWYLQGRLPLHTLRADIDFGFSEARTTYGVIGVKCWVYKGDILPQKKRQPERAGAGAF